MQELSLQRHSLLCILSTERSGGTDTDGATYNAMERLCYILLSFILFDFILFIYFQP
jgi:hypothetical protein